MLLPRRAAAVVEMSGGVCREPLDARADRRDGSDAAQELCRLEGSDVPASLRGEALPQFLIRRGEWGMSNSTAKASR